MKYFNRFVLLSLLLSASACFGAYNAAKPADNEYVADVPALVRENFRAIKDDAIVNAGTVSGLSVGNASGNIPRSNGTLNTNLNADLLDGYHASAFNASDALNVRLDGSRAMTGNLKFSGNYGILQSTSDGADSGQIYACGGGYTSGNLYDRGAAWILYGNEFTSVGGQARYYAGNAATGDHVFYTGASTERFRIAYDGTITAASSLKFSTSATISPNTDDGADNKYLTIAAGGPGRWGNGGGWIQLTGNEFGANPGVLFLGCGNAASIRFCGAADAEKARMNANGNLLLGTTTDDGVNKLQVNGSAYFASTVKLPNNVAYSCRNSSGVDKPVVYVNSSNQAVLSNTAFATVIQSNGTLTHNGSTIWTAANDGAGSGLDADRVQGVGLNPQEKTAQTMGAAGWYRIAQSASGIGRNHGIIQIDWAQAGYHGGATLAAGNHYGGAGGTGLNLLGLSFYPSGAPAGITKARIVYHTTYSGNYAYLEVYADRNLSNTVAYRTNQALGWTLINATAGSIPSGYTSQEIAFSDCNLNHGKKAWQAPGTYSWVCPPGVWKVWIDAVGGGGGGGNGNGSTIFGGGGGAGGCAKDYEVSVTPGTSYTVVVGAGGQGGISTTNNGYGSPGTDTTFNGVTMGGAGAGAGDIIGGQGGSGVTSYGGAGADGGGGKSGMGGSGIFGGGNFPTTPLGAGGSGVYFAGVRASNGGNGFLSITW